MFEQIAVPGDVLVLHFSDTMTVDDARRCHRVLQEALKTRGAFGLVFDFCGLSDISVDALTSPN